MDITELVIECNIHDEIESELLKLGVIKYYLPMINSYVIEIEKNNLPNLEGIEWITSITNNAEITAQMNNTRTIVNLEDEIETQKFTGNNIAVAVLDTGVAPVDDLITGNNRIIAFKDFVNNKEKTYDDNAHGTHVAGVIAGNGYLSKGRYRGIATKSKIVALKILDEKGKGKTTDVLAGIQWMISNREKYNIRVANLSIGTIDIGSRDPLVKAVEKAWDEGIVMVIAAGNNGPEEGSVTSPGISRKVITVGACDDSKTVTIWENSLVNFSGRGPTSECILKPDIIAPGANIVSCLTNSQSLSKRRYSSLKIVDKNYVEMSGTSMATPVVAGAIALLLEKKPELTPNDVKLILKHSSKSLHYDRNQQGWGLLDIVNMLSNI